MSVQQHFIDSLIGKNCVHFLGPMLPEKLLSEVASPLIVVDGGSHFLSQIPAPIDDVLLVGDGDSGENMDVLLSPEKDVSDFAYALSLLPSSIRELKLWGFLGGRRDHELANLGEVHHFLSTRREVQVDFDHVITALAPGNYQFSWHGLFSLMTWECSRPLLRGQVKYALDGERELRRYSSHGLSNEANGQFELEVTTPAYLFWGDKIN